MYQFTDKRNLKNSNNKNTGLVSSSIYYTWKNIKSTDNNNKFKISNLERWIWIAWWFLFNFRHSRLLRIYHQKASKSDWKSSHTNLH